MKLKKLLKYSLAISLVFGCASFVTGCNKDDNSSSKKEDKQYEIYKLAVEAGMTDLSYEQWLVTIKGEKGEKGDDGHTPTITIGNNGNWHIDGVDTNVKASGSTGESGTDGSTWLTGTVSPNDNIGKNGDFYFDSLAQKIYYKQSGAWILKSSISDGKDGQNGKQIELRTTQTYIQWSYVGENSWNNLISLEAFKGRDGIDAKEVEFRATDSYIQWKHAGGSWNNLVDLNLLVGEKGNKGDDGLTPFIGHNGNWWIGEEDTGVKAAASDGKNGDDGQKGDTGEDGLTPFIGQNGNWWIGEEDTGVKAVGSDGKNGNDGKDGENGKDGVSVVSISSTTDKWGIKVTLTYNMSDSTTRTSSYNVVDPFRYYAVSDENDLYILINYGVKNVRLINDVTISSTIEIGNSLNIDLNGYSISSGIDNLDTAFKVSSYDETNQVNVVISNGYIGNVLDLDEMGDFVFAETSIDKGIFISSNSNVNVELSGVCVSGNSYGIATDKNYSQGKVSINESMVISTSNNGGAAVYLASNSKYDFVDSYFTGYSGIYAKSGDLTITRSFVEGKGASKETIYVEDGFESTGSAIVLDSSYGYDNTLDVVISSSNIVSNNKYGIEEVVTSSNDVSVESYATCVVDEGVSIVDSINAIYVNNSEQFKDAISNGYERIALLSDVEVDETIVVNSNLTIYGNGNSISASSSYNYLVESDGSHVYSIFYIDKNYDVSFKDVVLDGNNITRSITALNGLITFDDVHVINGVKQGVYRSGGVFIGYSARFTMNSGTILGNDGGVKEVNSENYYLYYSSDLWIGANAIGSLVSINGGSIGNVFVNANSYSANNPGSFTLNGGNIDSVYVEYDSGYGAAFNYQSGNVSDIYVSSKSTGVVGDIITNGKTGVYYGGLSYVDSIVANVDVWDGSVSEVPEAIENVITISSASELAGLAKSVNEGNTYKGVTINLANNINLNNINWTPIGYGYVKGNVVTGNCFEGYFDGQGYTIYNLNVIGSMGGMAQENPGSAGVGLFGYINGRISNLNVDGASVYGNHYVGVVSGFTYWSSITNVHVNNAKVSSTYHDDDESGDKAGIITGYLDGSNLTNSSATDSIIDAGRDAGQLIGCIHSYENKDYTTGNSVRNVTVSWNKSGLSTGNNIKNELVGRFS